jgi:uncharacterized protein
MELELKFKNLKDSLQNLGSVAIAYSGGVDSTFLLKVAADALGNKIIAVTAKSSTYPEREFKEAVKYIEGIKVKHIVIISEELEIEEFAKNPVNRCYYCKKELFSKIRKVADDNNINAVLDGSNADDASDFRPGMTAARELKVISPLKDAGLTKNDIRELSKELGVPTWDKPAFACLSSRFPYGNEITVEKLNMVERAEQYLLDLGFKQIRVRHHENMARVEVNAEERYKFFDVETMNKVGNELKSIGFKYVTLDLLGYRTGSMNEVLSETEKNLKKVVSI